MLHLIGVVIWKKRKTLRKILNPYVIQLDKLKKLSLGGLIPYICLNSFVKFWT